MSQCLHVRSVSCGEYARVHTERMCTHAEQDCGTTDGDCASERAEVWNCPPLIDRRDAGCCSFPGHYCVAYAIIIARVRNPRPDFLCRDVMQSCLCDRMRLKINDGRPADA